MDEIEENYIVHALELMGSRILPPDDYYEAQEDDIEPPHIIMLHPLIKDVLRQFFETGEGDAMERLSSTEKPADTLDGIALDGREIAHNANTEEIIYPS